MSWRRAVWTVGAVPAGILEVAALEGMVLYTIEGSMEGYVHNVETDEATHVTDGRMWDYYPGSSVPTRNPLLETTKGCNPGPRRAGGMLRLSGPIGERKSIVVYCRSGERVAAVSTTEGSLSLSSFPPAGAAGISVACETVTGDSPRRTRAVVNGLTAVR